MLANLYWDQGPASPNWLWKTSPVFFCACSAPRVSAPPASPALLWLPSMAWAPSLPRPPPLLRGAVPLLWVRSHSGSKRSVSVPPTLACTPALLGTVMGPIPRALSGAYRTDGIVHDTGRPPDRYVCQVAPPCHCGCCSETQEGLRNE